VTAAYSARAPVCEDSENLRNVRMSISEQFDRFSRAGGVRRAAVRGPPEKTSRGFVAATRRGYLMYKDWLVARPFADRVLDTLRTLPTPGRGGQCRRMEALRRFLQRRALRREGDGKP
jgi:hypothetical protein